MKDPKKTVFDFPCHTQGTERFIPLISNSADKVADNQREGYALATIDSREKYPSDFTKTNYKFS